MPKTAVVRSTSRTKNAALTVKTDLAQHEMVLLAFAHAANWTTKPVPYEELVLQAWMDFKDTFSLRNHPEHPDASDIHKRIYQNLIKEGYVVSLRNKIFRLTDRGVAAAGSVQGRLDGIERSSAGERMGREEGMWVDQAARSRVFATWKSKGPDELLDYDAGVFFGFTTGTEKRDRALRVEAALRILEKAKTLGVIPADELLALAQHLATRYPNLYQ